MFCSLERLHPGRNISFWWEEIEKALQDHKADVAVLLITKAALASIFCHHTDVPEVIRQRVVWVAVETSMYKHTLIADLHCVNNPERPVSRFRGDYLNGAWLGICDEILKFATGLAVITTESRPSFATPLPALGRTVQLDTVAPQKDAAPSFEEVLPDDAIQIKKQGLLRRRELLNKQWKAEHEALMLTLDPMAKIVHEDRLQQIERDQTENEAKLFGLDEKQKENATLRSFEWGDINIGSITLPPSRETVAPISPIITPPQPQRSDIKINSVDGSMMIWIPAGVFLMGGKGYDERPIHAVRLDGFWMQPTQVTVRQYEAFVVAKYAAGEQIAGHAAEMPQFPYFNSNWSCKDHPMVNVSWHEAEAYCEWAKLRLPTEAEWEYACRGGMEGKEYPWGDDWDGSKCVNSVGENNPGGTRSVGKYPANGYRLHEMSGNVLEWCVDWYSESYYISSPSDHPKRPEHRKGRVLRGGCWNGTYQNYFRCAYRNYIQPDSWDNYVGFRCCTS